MDLLVTKKVIERVVPKFILDLNPVVSGGFMLNLYMMQSLEYRKNLHLKKESLHKPGYFFNEKLTEDQLLELIFNRDISTWRDIDIFFVKDEINQINNFIEGFLTSKEIEESDYIKKRFTTLYNTHDNYEFLNKNKITNSAIISDHVKKVISEKFRSSDASDEFIIKNQNYTSSLPYGLFIAEDKLFFNFHHKFESKLAISYDTKLHAFKNVDDKLKNIISIVNSCSYPTYVEDVLSGMFEANFTKEIDNNSSSTRDYKIQFIKKVADNVNSVINNFDIAICSIAWHKDDVYFGDKFFEAINSEYLIMNDFSKLVNLNISNRFYSSKRMDKYSERYNKKFDKISVEYLTMLAIDYLSISQKNSDDGADTEDEEKILMTDIFLKKLFKDKKISPTENDFDITNYNVNENSSTPTTPDLYLNDRSGIGRLGKLMMSPHWNDSNNIYFLPHIDNKMVRLALELGKKIDLFCNKKDDPSDSKKDFLANAVRAI